MNWEDQLQDIEDQYYAQDEEKTAAHQQLMELHRQLFGTPEEEDFIADAQHICGGVYLPELFWRRLAQFMAESGTAQRQSVHELFQSLVDSDFDENLLLRFKPLATVYMASEKQFEIDRLEAQVFADTHPQVKEYFTKLSQFGTKNPHVVEAYRRKFSLVREEFPDFGRFDLPVNQLEEELG